MMSELFQAMRDSGNYENDLDIQETIAEMKKRIRAGEDPEEVLFDEGFEPDFVFDLI